METMDLAKRYSKEAKFFLFDLIMPLRQRLGNFAAPVRWDLVRYPCRDTRHLSLLQFVTRLQSMSRGGLCDAQCKELGKQYAGAIVGAMVARTPLRRIERLVAVALKDPAYHATQLFDIYRQLSEIQEEEVEKNMHSPMLPSLTPDMFQSDFMQEEGHGPSTMTSQERLHHLHSAMVSENMSFIANYKDFLDFVWLPVLKLDQTLRQAFVNVLSEHAECRAFPWFITLLHAMDYFPSFSLPPPGQEGLHVDMTYPWKIAPP